MPPQRGMWIPAGTVHELRIVGAVKMHSLYFAPKTMKGMPEQCQVLDVSAFMRSLIAEAMKLPEGYEPKGRARALMLLIEEETRQLPHLPLSLPFPLNSSLARRCQAFLSQPTAHSTIDEWSGSLGMSRRTFTRMFQRETGLSLMNWRQQACLMAALPRLAAGDSVTSVATDFGYDNPAAFSAMFKRTLAMSPRQYFRSQ
jgi:AraC-like DNA-binding protein